MKKISAVNWHLVVSQALTGIIGILGYFQPGFPTHSTLVETVVPAVSALAISTLAAVFSHSPAATLQQAEKTAQAVAASDNSPAVHEALSNLASSLTSLESTVSKLASGK